MSSTLRDQIKEQGDLINKLKQEKAEKIQVSYVTLIYLQIERIRFLPEDKRSCIRLHLTFRHPLQ